jgi:hypothetical protein
MKKEMMFGLMIVLTFVILTSGCSNADKAIAGEAIGNLVSDCDEDTGNYVCLTDINPTEDSEIYFENGRDACKSIGKKCEAIETGTTYNEEFWKETDIGCTFGVTSDWTWFEHSWRAVCGEELDEDLLVHYEFEENWQDSSDNENTLFHTSGIEFIDEGVGKSVNLPGKGKKFLFLQSKSNWLHPEGFSNIADFSVSLWVKTEANYSIAKGLVSAANVNEDNEFLLYNPHDLKVYLHGKVKDTNINLMDNVWHHLVVTREGGIIRVYVDSMLKKTYTGLYSQPLDFEVIALGQELDVYTYEKAVGNGLYPDYKVYQVELDLPKSPSDPWYVNRRVFTTSKNQAYKGLIDEFKLYNHALSSKEVKEISANEALELLLGKFKGDDKTKVKIISRSNLISGDLKKISLKGLSKNVLSGRR